ncbi:UNVERIFIED_CONTAM: hypothetical protein Sradi_3706600 [Sesamum radiatum]|uniref:Uncharacterized protein n=1 Tax=Sesamum radiatum TaxID=300843 RepID=A0AAW2PXG8_SESRA
MAMVMDLDHFPNFSYSTPTTASTDGGCNWNDWSPVVDWEELSARRISTLILWWFKMLC